MKTIYKNQVKPNNSVYSDRLLQWDWDKHNELCMKHFGDESQWWDNRNVEKIQDFLRDYLDDDSIILCEILKDKNRSNGYPIWLFQYKSKK